jgi:hypothetical protein
MATGTVVVIPAIDETGPQPFDIVHGTGTTALVANELKGGGKTPQVH